MNYHWTMT